MNSCLVVHYLLFIECLTKFYPAEEETLRLSMDTSQPMEEKPRKEQYHVERGGKRKRKAHATPIHSVPETIVVPLLLPPPSTPMPQNNKNNVDLSLHDIALTLSPPQVVIASTPSNFIFQSQHMVVEAFDGSNIQKMLRL